MPEDENYYKSLSQDMYTEVGRLARRLSMSIRDVGRTNLDHVDLQSAGEQLEMAKDQLEDVVKMTESATLTIMDHGETIQGALDRARSIMQQVNTGQAASADGEREAQQNAEAARQELDQCLEGLTGFLNGLSQDPMRPLLEEAGSLAQEMAQAGSAPAPAAAPAAAATETRFQFPMNVVFQTIYELCTNETVKKHIKAMWESGDESFDQAQLEKALNQVAPSTPDEDNFLNMDLKAVLKVLFQGTSNERFQAVLKKMASTMDQIFLDQNLPLEAVQVTVTAEAPPEPAGPAGPSPEMVKRANNLVGRMQQVAGSLLPPKDAGRIGELLDRIMASGAGTGASNTVDPELLKELETAVETIMASVNSIIESLSFQDLAGQTIYKIVRLLTDFQVQLLAMVVSFGTKIKAKEEKVEVSASESERMAQEEVDKVLSGIKAPAGEAADAEGAGAGAELDQDAINGLLDSMGF